jgi:glycine/D-amino acid oxidase-like deaminating enzyme
LLHFQRGVGNLSKCLTSRDDLTRANMASNRKSTPDVDVAVIGAGFFGCEIALALRDLGVPKVTLIEKEGGILRRASAINQARIHNGYHYPRAICTAERSRKSFSRFVEDYAHATLQMRSIYAVARGSKVSARQFQAFCGRIGAPCRDVTGSYGMRFNRELIEAVFETRELVFDTCKLAAHIERRLAAADVSVQLSSPAAITSIGDNHVALSLRGGSITARHVVNATYASLDEIGAPIRPVIKRELAEIVLIQVPSELQDTGITVMDGPYFSVMPFPSTACHSLTHVRYTPHHARTGGNRDERHVRSRATSMIRDAARYLPCIARARIKRSLYEWKAVLQETEYSDERPIFIETSPGARRVVSILGGKIDNIYDALDFVRSHPWSY